MSMLWCAQFIVTGRVQGVGFRYGVLQFVQQNLPELKGFVRNRPDHTVEVVAQGSVEALELLQTYLQRGPLFARVDQLRQQNLPLDETLPTFSIRG